MEDSVILKVFALQNGKRTYKAKTMHRFVNVNEAQEYILSNNLLFYDLKVGGAVIDRDGNGAPETKKAKKYNEAPPLVDFIDPEKVLDFLRTTLLVEFANWYELKKDSGMIAVQSQYEQHAEIIRAFITLDARFSILQTAKDNWLSFSTNTNEFNNTRLWQKKELPRPDITKSSTNETKCIFSALAEMFSDSSF